MYVLFCVLAIKSIFCLLRTDHIYGEEDVEFQLCSLLPGIICDNDSDSVLETLNSYDILRHVHVIFLTKHAIIQGLHLEYVIFITIISS